jgi:hypothetical protein
MEESIEHEWVALLFHQEYGKIAHRSVEPRLIVK